MKKLGLELWDLQVMSDWNGYSGNSRNNLGIVMGVLFYCQAGIFEGKESKSKIWNPPNFIRRKSKRRKRTSRENKKNKTFQKYWNWPLGKEWISRDCPLSQSFYIYIYPPKDCFRFHMGLHLYSTRPEKIKNPQLKGHSTISYIFLFWWFPLLNFKKLGSRADRRNSDQFSVQNQVLKTWSACFLVWSINVFQGKCSKDRILGNQMWLWSVGVCFEANQLHIESRHLLAYLNA